jgi:RNA methyltransferase, TrmH family
MTTVRTHHRLKRHSTGSTGPHGRTLLRVCGLPAVSALFERDPGRVERLFFEPQFRIAASDFCATLARARKPYREVGTVELARVAGTLLHGGIAAISRPRPLAAFDPMAVTGWAVGGEPILILDGIGNPHNLGAIVRTAAFFGIKHVVLADRPDQALPSDASYRVAEGGLEHVTLYQASLGTVLVQLRRSYHVVGSAPGREKPVMRCRTEKAPALILGNEEKGMDPATFALCDEIVTIPGNGQMQSLNVAAAAAILIYAHTGGRS